MPDEKQNALEALGQAWLFRWASETGAHGMPHPEELEWLDYERVGQHPRYPTSWLYRRAVST